MLKNKAFLQQFLNVLFWLALAAAFVSPIATDVAFSAGATMQFSLLWTLSIATIFGLVLYEAAARMVVASGKSLGELLGLKYPAVHEELRMVLFLVVAISCAVYQVTYLAAATAALQTLTVVHPLGLAAVISILSIGILWCRSIHWIAYILGGLAIFSIALAIVLVLSSELRFYSLLESTLLPALPATGSEQVFSLLAIPFLPYIMFLASGLAQGEALTSIQRKLPIAVLLGGLLLLLILVTGVEMPTATSLHAFIESDSASIWHRLLFFGLAWTSVLVAPFAAAVTAKSLFHSPEHNWSGSGLYFRLVALVIVIIGLLFVLLQVDAAPALLFVRVLNALFLPIVTISLFFIVNDRSLFLDGYTNTLFSNICMLTTIGFACFWGLYDASSTLDLGLSIQVSLSITILVVFYLSWRVFFSYR